MSQCFCAVIYVFFYYLLGTYSILDDMFANLLTQYGYTKEGMRCANILNDFFDCGVLA